MMQRRGGKLREDRDMKRRRGGWVGGREGWEGGVGGREGGREGWEEGWEERTCDAEERGCHGAVGC
jgi:hypothetical protein